jgi:hypothetical protein
MSASLNLSRDEYLNEMDRLMDAFERLRGANSDVTTIRNCISNLKNRLAFEMAEEVAQLVLNDASEESIKELLESNFPSGVSIGNIEEMLKLVYVGTDTKNLKKAINFVQIFDSCHQAKAYSALYEDVKFKKHTEEPEILLLQKKIRKLYQPTTDANETKEQVDADCRKIISRIVKGIEEKDYSISIYVAKELEKALLNDNMTKIVREFYNGTSENTLLLIQYSRGLPYIQNQYFLIDALLKELETSKLLDSESSMHLWALAKSVKGAGVYQKLCADATEKLAVNKMHFFGHYQRYVENSDKQKIRYLHMSNAYLEAIVRDFVSFYYNGEVDRTQNLLAAANAMPHFDALKRVLSQLHEEMAKSDQMNSFEAFRLFNLVKFHKRDKYYHYLPHLPSYDQKPFEQLEKKAPACLQQLLWQEDTTEFQVVNKFFNATLSFHEDNKSVVCFDSGDKQSNQTWTINIGKWNSLLTLTHAQKKLHLGTDEKSSPCLFETAEPWWKVKVMDEHHFKIFYEAKGK